MINGEHQIFQHAQRDVVRMHTGMLILGVGSDLQTCLIISKLQRDVEGTQPSLMKSNIVPLCLAICARCSTVCKHLSS